MLRIFLRGYIGANALCWFVRVAHQTKEESTLLEKLLASQDTTVVSEFAGKRVVRGPVPITKDEPPKLEPRHFIECVRADQTPAVSLKRLV